MAAIKSVAVFCGSRAGTLPAFRAEAEALGRGLAEAGIRLVFGGGRVGLMGAVADAALAAGGDVVGVIPEFLTRLEVAHQGVDPLIISASMHERKQRMYDLSDAFVTLPGGVGTFDETIEVITWRQLGLHDKPILLCDVAGSAAPLVNTILTAIDLGFAPSLTRRLFTVMHGAAETLEALREMAPGAGTASARL